MYRVLKTVQRNENAFFLGIIFASNRFTISIPQLCPIDAFKLNPRRNFPREMQVRLTNTRISRRNRKETSAKIDRLPCRWVCLGSPFTTARFRIYSVSDVGRVVPRATEPSSETIRANLISVAFPGCRLLALILDPDDISPKNTGVPFPWPPWINPSPPANSALRLRNSE